jgi:hypothetical protein
MPGQKNVKLGRLPGVSGRDRLEAHGVVLLGAWFTCTRCGAIKPASSFGLRLTSDGYVRNQAQCTRCRDLPRPKRRKLNTPTGSNR